MNVMTFLSTMEISPVLLVLVGILGVVLLETTLTFEQFRQHLRIEEKSQVRDGTNTDFKVYVNNVSNVQSRSSSKTIST